MALVNLDVCNDGWKLKRAGGSHRAEAPTNNDVPVLSSFAATRVSGSSGKLPVSASESENQNSRFSPSLGAVCAVKPTASAETLAQENGRCPPRSGTTSRSNPGALVSVRFRAVRRGAIVF